MSDESSDEYFASADEGSINEEDEIEQSHVTQCALKTPLSGNVAGRGTTFEAPAVLGEYSGPGLSLPVDEVSCDLTTSTMASSVKMQSALPQKLIEPISVEPKHIEQKLSVPVTDFTAGDTEPVSLNVAETLQPTAPSHKLCTFERPMVEDPITGVKDDKLNTRELNLDENQKEKREEPIKKLAKHVNTLDASPIPCAPKFLHVAPDPVVATVESSPDHSSCQQECTPSPFDAPPQTTSGSLNEPEEHGTGELNQPESQPSYSNTGDERTHITSANLLESEEVNAWDDDSWDEAEQIEDVRESSEEPGPHPSVVSNNAFSSTSGAPTHRGKIESSVDGTSQESPTRKSVTRVPEANLIGTLDEEPSRTGELETLVSSFPSGLEDFASKAHPIPFAVNAKEQIRRTHPAGDPAPEQIVLDALSSNSKREAECFEQSVQPRNTSVADKHDLETESNSTINIVHKTSIASRASDEAEGWDLSCVSALSSIPQTSKSSPCRQDKTESDYSVAFKQMPDDWDADWINEEEEEEEVIKVPPDLTTPNKKKDTLPEPCKGGTRPEETNDGWDFDEWDCVDKTPAVAAVNVTPKPPAHSQITHKTADGSNDVPILPDYLSTAATSLVKTVGGGLASFVDNFSLFNLSATLAAFDGAPPSAQQPLSTDSTRDDVKPQNETEPREIVVLGPTETETKVAVTDDGWGLTGMSWGSFAKSLSSTVENRGMQLIQGGVDVLETIGKKTFTALKETDPGLSYTKKFLRAPQISQTTRLSQVLREASRQHQENLSGGPTRATEDNAQHRRGDFAYQLEARHALVHMEALDLVSSRASAHLHAKITSLENREFPRHTTEGDDMSISSLTNEGGVLDKIWQTMQAVENQSEEESDAVENIMVNLNLLGTVCPTAAIQQKYKQLREKPKESTHTSSATDVFCIAIDSLAEATTAMLTYLHKLAECMLSRPEKVQDGFLDLAQKVTLIIQAGKRYNESLCSEYVELLKQTENSSLHQMGSPSVSDEVRPPISSKRHMVNLFLETGTANDYLSSASGSFVPIIQLLCINSFFPNSPS